MWLFFKGLDPEFSEFTPDEVPQIFEPYPSQELIAIDSSFGKWMIPKNYVQSYIRSNFDHSRIQENDEVFIHLPGLKFLIKGRFVSWLIPQNIISRNTESTDSKIWLNYRDNETIAIKIKENIWYIPKGILLGDFSY